MTLEILIEPMVIFLQEFNPGDVPDGSGGAFSFAFRGFRNFLLVIGAICAFFGMTRLVINLYNGKEVLAEGVTNLFIGMFICVAIYGFVTIAFRM